MSAPWKLGPSIRSSSFCFPESLLNSLKSQALSSLWRRRSVAAEMVHKDAVWSIIALAVVYTAVVATRSTLGFPFLRTLVECDYPSPPDVDRDSSSWSGSAHCNDTGIVVDQAQVAKAFASGCDLALQCIALPVYGSVADSFGRCVVEVQMFMLCCLLPSPFPPASPLQTPVGDLFCGNAPLWFFHVLLCCAVVQLRGIFSWFHCSRCAVAPCAPLPT
jgi:hypothetical protein